MPNRKVGIMGGTFNPIHNGHLILAENARQQFDLDQIYFLPTGRSPHKKDRTAGDIAHCCNMVELAIEDNERFVISKLEAMSDEVNYTYHTLEQLLAQEPDTEFLFLMGADSLFDFDFWRNPARICELSKLLVAKRDVLDEAQVRKQADALQEKYGALIYLLDSPNVSVSSHEIRDRVRTGSSIRYLLPESVRTYIESQGLYHG